MKIQIFYIWFLLLPLNAIAQRGTLMDSFLIAKTPTTYSSIISNLREGSCENLQRSEICFDELKAALLLDVVSYYHLEDKYETKLKISAFMETDEYKSKLEDLKKIKQSYLSDCMYLDITKSDAFEISDYNLDLGDFVINLGIDTKGRINYFSQNYEVKSIPFKIVVSNMQGEGEILYNRIILLPMSKKEAISLEDNRSRLKCLMIFKPKTIIKEDHPLFPGYHNYEYYATVDKVRLILIDPSTDKIYLDKNYYLPIAPTKK